MLEYRDVGIEITQQRGVIGKSEEYYNERVKKQKQNEDKYY